MKIRTPFVSTLTTGAALASLAFTIQTTLPDARADHDGFEVASYTKSELFFEQNASDGDLGLHLKVDGEGWKTLVLTDFNFTPLIYAELGGNLGHEIGLTEVSSESAEPSFDELPRREFLALFPAGLYYYIGETVDGRIMLGVTRLTHTLPDEAVLLWPEEDGEIDASEDLVVEWEPVPDPRRSAIEFYEVIVEKDEDGELLRTFTVIMLPGQTSITVPSEFLEAGKDYKAEIIAQETSGNRTSVEVPFATADEEDGGKGNKKEK